MPLDGTRDHHRTDPRYWPHRPFPACRHLSRTAPRLGKAALIAAVTPLPLGLDLRRVVKDFANYFRPLAERTLPSLDASVPLLTLSAQLEAAA